MKKILSAKFYTVPTKKVPNESQQQLPINKVKEAQTTLPIILKNLGPYLY